MITTILSLPGLTALSLIALQPAAPRPTPTVVPDPAEQAAVVRRALVARTVTALTTERLSAELASHPCSD